MFEINIENIYHLENHTLIDGVASDFSFSGKLTNGKATITVCSEPALSKNNQITMSVLKGIILPEDISYNKCFKEVS